MVFVSRRSGEPLPRREPENIRMPNHRSPHASVAAGALLLLTSGLAGCALHWPWHHRAPSAPAPVHVLGVVGPGGGAAPQIAQSWDRNTLLLDLTAHPTVKFVRLHWEVARWGRGTETPMFEFDVRLKEVPADILKEATAEARALA